MKARGREILYTIRDLERKDVGPLRVGRIAREAGFRDGRSVAAKLRRLEAAGLVVNERGIWVSTLRGQEVERLCSSVDANRPGGEFRPLVEVLENLTERLAVLV